MVEKPIFEGMFGAGEKKNVPGQATNKNNQVSPWIIGLSHPNPDERHPTRLGPRFQNMPARPASECSPRKASKMEMECQTALKSTTGSKSVAWVTFTTLENMHMYSDMPHNQTEKNDFPCFGS